MIYIIAAAAVLYFGYTVVKARYFPPKNSGAGNQKNETQLPTSNQNGTPSSMDQNSASPENVSPGDENQPLDGTHLYVSSGDCDNNCKKFRENAENLKYCQEVCGDIPVTKKNSEADCAGLAGLEKDYCWRDLAVSKKDFSFCEKISDAKLKTVCRSRVTEEVLN
jgi:hypothetical protein